MSTKHHDIDAEDDCHFGPFVALGIFVMAVGMTIIAIGLW